MSQKIYNIQPLTLNYLDNQEFAQLMTETAQDINAFIKKAKPELTYVSKMALFEPTLERFKASLHSSKKSVKAADLTAADRDRDEALTTLFNLHKGYALVKTPAIKAAYGSLAQLFTSYKGVAEANYEKETESINHLLGKLAEASYQEAVAQLNLTVFVEGLKSSQQAFDKVYQERLKELEGKKPGQTRELRLQLTEYYTFFVEYTAISAYAYPERPYFVELRDQLNVLRSRYKKHTATKKATPKTVTTEAEEK